MELLIAVISTLMALLKMIRQARETYGNAGRFPTEHHPLQHPELEVLHQSSRMARWETLPKSPSPLPEGV